MRNTALLAAASAAALPLAMQRTGGRVMAAGPRGDDPVSLFNQINDALSTGFRQRDDQISNLTDAMTALQSQVDNGGLATRDGSIMPVDRDYTTAFASYTRRGDGMDALKAANASGERATVQAAMSVGSATDGGYLAPVEFDRKLYERQRATSPMRRLATVQSTSVGAYTSLWNGDTWGSGWVGETAARPQTATPLLAPIPFAVGEIYANAAATQRLLDDAVIDVDNWLVQSLEREFSRQENIAFLAGDGVNKPFGLLQYAPGGAAAATHPGGPLTVVEADIDYDGLVDFAYSLPSPYRNGSAWLMNSLTAATIAKLKDADGRPIWREGLIVGQPATLLGLPVEIDEGMPAPTAGNLAIAFGNFRQGYLINDRLGTRLLRDPYTNKPFVMFYATKRVGAGVLDPFAIRLLKVAA